MHKKTLDGLILTKTQSMELHLNQLAKNLNLDLRIEKSLLYHQRKNSRYLFLTIIMKALKK
jgi:hypothetical protein